MEFDISKIYTVINADELSTGCGIYVADDLETLKHLVEKGGPSDILQSVRDKNYIYRFVVEEDDEAHAFAYLITSPLNTSLKWQDLKIGDVIRGKNSGCEYMVTMRDTRDSVVSHIGSGGVWLHDSELSSYEKVSLC